MGAMLNTVLKKLLEEHSVITLISIMITGIIFFYILSDYLVSQQIAGSLVVFTAIFLILVGIRKVCMRFYAAYNHVQYVEDINSKAEAKFNSFFDELSFEEQNIIYDFIDNNNKTMLISSSFARNLDIISNKIMMNQTAFKGDIRNVNMNEYWIHNSLKCWHEGTFHPISDGIVRCKIRDEMFEAIKNLYSQKKSLGNFNREKLF